MPILLAFVIVFLEGYTTLAVQIIVLRIAAPIIGTNVVATSIIIGVMLVALSAGYWRGGEISHRLDSDGRRKKLAINFFISGLLFGIGIPLFSRVNELLLATTQNYFFTIFAASTLVLAIPVYLASQTTPLISDLVKHMYTGQTVGRLIFFSTMGSFLGSVLTTIVLFPLIGVVRNVALVVAVFALLMLLITPMIRSRFLALLLFLCSTVIFYDIPRHFWQVFAASSSYQDIVVYTGTHAEWQVRIFALDGALSSGIILTDSGTQKSFSYVNYVMGMTAERQPRSVLVIGWAGFVYPQLASRYNFVERIDVSDIDPSLPSIAERYFLQEPLSPKIVAHSLGGARYFLNSTVDRYDMILVDAFAGSSIPQELLTREFFSELSKHINPGGAIVFNAILDTPLTSLASTRIFSTMRSIYGEVWYYALPWTQTLSNILISTVPFPLSIPSRHVSATLYSDDRNSAALDIAQTRIAR